MYVTSTACGLLKNSSIEVLETIWAKWFNARPMNPKMDGQAPHPGPSHEPENIPHSTFNFQP
jgi:hypothetical protein